MAVEAIDVNCDMGEGFGAWQLRETDDATLIKLISSANIAAGFHAGDPSLMDRTVRMAAEHGVGIGAHPGYRDLQGFGRRRIDGSPAELVNDIIYQVGAIREFAKRHGAALQHVKPHGALYMELAVNEEFSDAFVSYMRKVQPDTAIFCMGMSVTYRIAKAAGQPVIREFFADRDYADDGSIVFTRRVGRLDPELVADKVVKACRTGKVTSVAGNEIDIEFESICFHSDTLGSADIAEAMRRRLVESGIRIVPVSRILAR
ncbi:5-oxoprolinase subunit PxpA [Nitratireductor sp. ZSWI3]|uniref:5-oxoprolinase subunit PxpA n=1 Tax=Nitratireductor sp. ZSWI3 TaxID=2966359 RepID=UPI00214FFAE6|nr:5-oxoprolinase subunit PxpA [Nitratireductor sp. ZSWI3]MCR4268060.1 5-oxoprolinase subunit PxpA [Nitratireductor sp. ZSWI3]